MLFAEFIVRQIQNVKNANAMTGRKIMMKEKAVYFASVNFGNYASGHSVERGKFTI